MQPAEIKGGAGRKDDAGINEYFTVTNLYETAESPDAEGFRPESIDFHPSPVHCFRKTRK